jgi:membrane-associated phospholipid phosphatase
LLLKRVQVAVLFTLILGFGEGRSFAGNGIETSGDILVGVLPCAAGVLTLHHHDTQGMAQLAKSLCVTVGVTLALKYTIPETRPNGGEHSFPSGHTSVTFSSAEFLRKRYGWKWGVPAYAVAAFVGYSRIEAHQHYTHDVLAGAAVGLISSALFSRPFPRMNVEMVLNGKNGWFRLSYGLP